jgi:hypothetical protein
MVIPTFFIVGAPRCGTSSLFAYLDAHPKVYACEPKEPYHFGSDIALSWRPFADRKDYLQLFEGARDDQMAGEATVLYLYSKTAPHEIKAFSPSAKIIIMLRDPVEVLRSYHALNLLLLNDDLTDVEQALAAEPDRRLGRRIPWTCETPFALQYSTIVSYTEHVQRYMQVFGRDRVRCILFDDFQREPDRVYSETLAFLGLEPRRSPTFTAYNQTRRWRSQRLAPFVALPHRIGLRLCFCIPAGRARRLTIAAMNLALHLPTTALQDASRPSPMPPKLRSALRERFRDDVERLAQLLGRDLSSWVRSE